MVSTDDLARTYQFHHLMAHVDRTKMFLHNIHNHVSTRLYCVQTQTTLWILTSVSTSNPIPKIIKNWNVDGNVALGKLNYSRAVHMFTQYIISYTFSTKCVHCYKLHLKKPVQTTILNIISTTVNRIFCTPLNNICS
jgi:hypothetical protein